jgi:hypothetical protein
LAEPVNKYPWLFAENTIWDKYPFLLPNIIVVVFLFSSSIIGLFYLEEVHPNFRARMDWGRTFAKAARNVFKGQASNMPEYSVIETDEPVMEMSQIASGEVQTSEEQHPEDQTLEDHNPEEYPSHTPSAFSGQVMLQILSSAILGFLKIATLAMIPIFLATPQEPIQPPVVTMKPRRSIVSVKGGFGLDTTSTSNVLLSQAIATIVSQILIIPAIISRIGPLHTYRTILVVLSFVFFSMPFAAGLPSWAGMLAILITLWAYALATGLATTCSAIL